MWKKLQSYLILPREISTFERTYLARMNRIVLLFFYCHLPVFMGVAAMCDTGVGLAAGLTLLTLLGPTLAYHFFDNPRTLSVTFGFTAMAMGGLLVHFGQGPMQIEMHFYFFTLLALLSIFGNPAVIMVAAVTVAAHHGLLYFLLPRSVFNYEASIWAVVVHAAFVVLESVAACFMARSFFDNVIGLEKIVGERTQELDLVNRDMRLVLDNVGQGFLTIDGQGVMSQEKSAIVETWLGDAEPGMKFADYIGRRDPDFGAWFGMGLDEVAGDTLSLEMALDQLPKRLALGERAFELGYRPILKQGALDRLLIVMSDVTAEVARERFETEQREMVHMLEKVSKDRAGFVEYCEEANEIVTQLATDETMSTATMKRLVHTLKGNSALFGVDRISSLCHQLEDSMADHESGLKREERALLRDSWQKYHDKLAMFGGERSSTKIEIEVAEYEACLSALLRGAPRQDVARMVNDWKLEPMARRLGRVAEQARAIADRLGKSPLEIDIVHNNERLLAKAWAPFWGAFVHVIRNAIDHGIEDGGSRTRSGKPAQGKLELRTYAIDDSFFVEFQDDGRGIDWEGLTTRAKAAGLPAETREQLVEALFRDGITTRTNVSEFSGRGVGLGAVRAACRALGGDVTLSSATGKGTKVVFSVPIEATGREIRVASGSSTVLRAAAPSA